MKKVGLIFPGQGSQQVGMGLDFYETFAEAKQIFEEADAVLGYPLSKIIFQGPETDLTATKTAQVAIFVTSIAILRVLKSSCTLQPFCVAGLSLGEYTALVASGKLDFASALRLLAKRAELMNEACLTHPGTMAAVMGAEGSLVEQVLSQIDNVWIANYNCPGQIVISGTMHGVEKACIALKENGVRKVIPLNVSGAFHSGLMQSAENQIAPFIKNSPITYTSIPLIMNTTATRVDDVVEIKNNLIRQVSSSVRWHQSVAFMDMMGCDLFLEIGTGKILSGLVRKIAPQKEILALDKVSSLDEVCKQLNSGFSCHCI